MTEVTDSAAFDPEDDPRPEAMGAAWSPDGNKVLFVRTWPYQPQ